MDDGIQPPLQENIRKSIIIILVVLSILFIMLWVYVEWIKPAPFYWQYTDPEMAYFFSSLSIFRSAPYSYIDHPGTPLEIIGTILLASLRVTTGTSGDQFLRNILQDPSRFTTLAHGLITTLTLITTLALTRYASPLRDKKEVFFSLVVGISYFALFPGTSFLIMGIWGHHAFVFSLGTLILLLLMLRLRSGDYLSHKEPIYFGTAAGILTAFQIYLGTWVIGIGIAFVVFDWLMSRRVLHSVYMGLLTGISSLFGFVLATLPILHKYREFSWWIRSLLFHQGRYGTGSSGITSFTALKENLTSLISGAPILFSSLAIILGLIVLGYVRRKHSRSVWWIALCTGLILQVIVTIIIIAKHPGIWYLLAVAAVVPILLILMIERLRMLGGRWDDVLVAVGVVCMIGFIYSFTKFIINHNQQVDSIELKVSEYARYAQKMSPIVSKPPDDYLILWGYGSASPCYALRFGHLYTEGISGSNGIFSDLLDERCPNEYYFEVWRDSAYMPNGFIKVDEIEDWDVIVFGDRPYLPPGVSEQGEILTSDETGVNYGFRRR